MPVYALLGATGATGTAILRCLLSESPADLRLNIFVRSKGKLLKAFPQLQSTSAFPLNIIEGPITDQAALQQCLEDSDVIFMCIATNISAPGTSVSYDTASAIIDSLSALRQNQYTTYKAPTILQLRSASLNTNLSVTGSGFVHFCLYYVYADLEHACTLYETTAKDLPGLLDYVYVDPPAIHDADGTERTGYRLLTPETQRTEPYSTSLSYADLGAAFCEVAERREEFLGQSVVVSATGKVKETWGVLLGYIFQGAKGRLFG